MLEDRIRGVGLALGLDAVGLAPATPHARTEFLRDWVARGFAGEMDYLVRRLEERIDPRRVLPGARSLIVAGLLCAAPPANRGSDAGPGGAEPEEEGGGSPGFAGEQDSEGPTGRVARYAGGDDYHEVLLDRVRALEAALPLLADRPVRSRSYVDTGPVLERAAAERAGLGWIGKNACLIHPALGSHLMLGVVLTDLPLEPDAPVTDHCGNCRACLDVCPTDAFPEPYVLDATRCLSYTTIESRGPIPEALRAPQADLVFGCDLCQDVCPWNRSRPRQPLADPLGLRARLVKREAWQSPTLEWLLSLDEDAFAEATRKTALRRAGWRGLIRNALVAAGNAGDPRLRAAVARHADSDDAMLSEHAHWALARLEAGSTSD
jgi:epoxyqueuosine reductase